MKLLSDILVEIRRMSPDRHEEIQLNRELERRATIELIKAHLEEYDKYYFGECHRLVAIYNTTGIDDAFKEFGIKK